MQDVTLARIEELHQSVEVPTPGRSRSTILMCRSCTRERYPCPTLRIVDRAKAAAR